MKVAVLAEQLRQEVPGGIGTYVRGLLQGLAELGTEVVEVEVVASRGREHDPLEALGGTFRTTHFPHRLQMLLWDRGLGHIEGSADVLHRSSLAGPRSSSVPSTVMIHDLAWRAMPALTTIRGRHWHEAALRRARTSSAHLLTPSKVVAEQLIGEGIASSRITVVTEGADHLPLADHEAARRALVAAGVSGPFLLSVSTLEPRKNLGGLIEAHRRSGIDLPLVVVGPAGWGENLVGSDAVVLLGAQPAAVLAALYERCEVFCYVPHFEGFGLPPLEAAHHGAPVVVSTTVPSTEGLTGNWRVDPNDPDGIADALQRALEDGVARTSAKEQARSFAASHRWVDVARAHVAVWESLR